MTAAQPFQYQGSKRALASVILEQFPDDVGRLIEPFCGSAALSIAASARGQVRKFWLNDFNKPLAELLALMIEKPIELANSYAETWRDHGTDTLEHYYQIREQFNRSQEPRLLLYLLARCVKGAVRYNAEGLFNQSPDKRRLGTRPATMRENIQTISALLRGRTLVTALSYEEVLAKTGASDLVYMDPPYQGVCGERDSRYFSGIAFDGFVGELEKLNRRRIRYIVSYDGRLGAKIYGKPLPAKLELKLVELHAGRSSQATLLGRDELTVESLYLSPALSEQLTEMPAVNHRRLAQQMHLLETPRPHAKPAKAAKRVC